MPEWLQGLVSSVIGFFLGGGVVAWRKQRHDEKRGVREDVREDSKAERADWASFATETRHALDTERARNEAQATRIDTLSARLEEKDAAMRARDDFIDLLEAHIWAGKEPPPPARPAGI